MKTLAFALASVLVCLTVAAQADVIPGNKVENGDFDTALTGWAGGASWTDLVPDGGGAAIPASNGLYWNGNLTTGYRFQSGDEIQVTWDAYGPDADGTTALTVRFFSSDIPANPWVPVNYSNMIPNTRADHYQYQGINTSPNMNPDGPNVYNLKAGWRTYTATYTLPDPDGIPQGQPGAHPPSWAGGTPTVAFDTGPVAGIIYVDNVALTIVPEPGTLAMLGVGLFGLLAYAWRKRR